MSFTQILKEVVIECLQEKMMQDIERNLLIVGPGEFHYSPALNKEFKCLAGNESITREKLPESFLDQQWQIVLVKHHDEMLDLYNAIVLNAKDIEHEEVID